MQKGVVLSQEDVKKILAEYFKVNEKNIVKSQYSYFVAGVVPQQKGE